MPYRRTKRTRKAPAKRTRKMTLYRRPRRRPLPLTGYGKSKMVRLRYCQEVTLNPGLASIATHYFLANGMYDPDVTTGGHQPLGFDQMMLGYDHFTVIGSKIKATPMNTSTGTGTPGYFGIIIDDNASLSYTTASQVLESKQGKGAVMVTQKSINGNQRSAYRSFSAKKFLTKRNPIDDPQLKGSTSSDPTEKVYFGLWNAAVGNNDPDTSNFMVEIEYIAILSEPKFLAQS